ARGGPGTVLQVKPAIYREQVTVPASGSSGNPFVFQAVGSPVIIDGADDYGSPSLWSAYSGNVYRAAGVNWSPLQVFSDGARLAPSSASPASLPPGSFRFIGGQGLYANVGGGNPGAHQALVSHRNNGFSLSAKSWVTIDGFVVTRTQDR